MSPNESKRVQINLNEAKRVQMSLSPNKSKPDGRLSILSFDFYVANPKEVQMSPNESKSARMSPNESK